MQALTLVLSASLLFGGVASAQAPRDTAAPQSTKEQAGKDTDFAQKAAKGGKKEVQLAQTASTKAANADVKAYANRLVKDHTAANQELMSIMKTKRIAEAAPDKADSDKPEPWQSESGASFDRGFIDHAIDHHQKDIALFEAESKSGADAELKAFATKTLPTLREHLKQAQDLKSKLQNTTRQQ